MKKLFCSVLIAVFASQSVFAAKSDPSIDLEKGRRVGRVTKPDDKKYREVRFPIYEYPKKQNLFDYEKRDFRLDKPDSKALLIQEINKWVDEKEKAMKKDQKKALKVALDIITRLENKDLKASDRAELETQLAEIFSAIRFAYERPIKPIGLEPWNILGVFANPVIPPGKLGATSQNNSFITEKPIETLDLHAGFGRSSIPNLNSDLLICEYDEAKDGYGTHPGFDMVCGKEGDLKSKSVEDAEDVMKLKLRFGNEKFSGPFNSRIFWAMGYNVDPVDRFRTPRLRYNRNIFTEFYSRKHLGVQAKFLFLKFLNINGQSFHSAFAYVHKAVLETASGEEVINGAELRKRLLLKDQLDPQQSELDKNNYNEDVENQIKYLVFDDAVVKHPITEEYAAAGSWSYDELDHPERSELRGLSVLAAWVNNWDLRRDNNRLRLLKTEGNGLELVHFLSDVGSGLGKAPNALQTDSSVPNLLPWHVAEDEVRHVLLKSFNTAELNKAFNKGRISDMQAMIRKIARLSKDQIVQALKSAQMGKAETRLYLEKLLSRRNELILEFRLGQELKSALVPVNEKLDYDPNEGLYKIVEGKLVPRR